MENYNTQEILDLIQSGDNVVVDFWAEWCGPCKSFAPVFESTSKNDDFEGKVKFIKVNVDEHADLSVKYGIRSIPTIIMFKNGDVKDKKTGAMNKSSFETFISVNLES